MSRLGVVGEIWAGGKEFAAELEEDKSVKDAFIEPQTASGQYMTIDLTAAGYPRPMSDTVHELIGVYDADGTLLGEARYWIGARLGRTHCALCDITHGLFTERADWRRCRDQLDVEFRTYHRDDAPADVLAVGAPAPFVVARTARGLVALLGPQELDACAGDVDQFHQALTRACAEHHLDGI